jgi:DNA-directed RNA polymerase subunit L
MNVNLLKKEKDTMEIEIAGEDDTLLAPLFTQLLQDDKVDFTTYRRAHLQLDNPVLVVRVTEGKPQMALKRAAKAIANDYKELRAKIEKS